MAGTVVLSMSPLAPPEQAIEPRDPAGSPAEPARPPWHRAREEGTGKEGARIQLRAALGEAGEPWPAPTLQIGLSPQR